MGEIAAVSQKSKLRIWRERIEEQVHSGRSIRAFCEERHINYRTFYYWKRKLADLGQERSGGRFIALTGGFHSGGIHPTSGFSRIHLPNGVKIELGAGLESSSVNRLILSLCGVNSPPKDGRNAKS